MRRHVDRQLNRPETLINQLLPVCPFHAGYMLFCMQAKGIFTFAGCKFHIAKCKESTARVVMWRQLNVMNSFTLEATFAGSTLEK